MKKLVIYSLIFIGALTSCRKNLVPTPKEQPTPVAPTQTKELKVDADFEWNTNVTMDVTITPASTGVLLIQDENATAIYKAVVTPDQLHTANITVPAALNKLVIYFNGQKEEISNVRISKFACSLK